MSTALTERLDHLERELHRIHRELREVRILVAGNETREPEPSFTQRPPIPSPPPRRPDYVPTLPAPAEPARHLPDLSRLMSAPALAVAGGVVTLLGIVFLFVLAVERGWIRPEVRVAFGAAASIAHVTAGIVLQQRFGRLHSALAAVGAGIAGAYATLLSATVLYELLPSWAALVVAAGIAATGTVLALRWSSQLIAGIGLLGAILVPAVGALDYGLTTVGTAFAVFVTAAGIAVGIAQRWRRLTVLSASAGTVQVATLALHAQTPDPGVVATAGACALILVAGGIAWHLHRARLSLGGVPTTLVLMSGALVFYSAWLLFGGLGEGIALLAAATVYAAGSAWLFRIRAYRDLSTLIAVLALTAGAVGVATLLSGASLTYVWAAEAVLLFWLAPRVGEIRFQLAGLAYLALAIGHAVTNEARPEVLFTITSAPETAVPSLVALAVACAASAVWVRPWRAGRSGERGLFRLLAPLLHGLRENQNELRVALASGSGVFALVALAVGILAACIALGGSFEAAHAVISDVWGLAGAVALLLGLWGRRPALVVASLSWLILVTAKVLSFDSWRLPVEPRSAAFLGVGAALFAAAALLERSGWTPRRGTSALAATLSLGLGLAGLATLLDGTPRGLALLALAGVYAAAAGAFLRIRRDYSTLMWTFALGIAAAAATQLVSGEWLVVCYAAGAAVLSWLAVVVGERRLQLAAVAYAVASLVVLLGQAAPPADFFTAGPHPGRGVPAALAALAAILLLGLACGRRRIAGADALDTALDRRQKPLRMVSFWAAGALGVYALSLAVLELFELIRSGAIDARFQSGHTAVSAAWGVLGLVLLYLGLRRSARALQLGGFALFGLSVAKLFLYDLAQLSSMTRALSFLAVGAVLLLAGFFYQRLSSLKARGSGQPEAS